jgi:tRNA1(Val) A37 N6-methylase TrmN6
VNSDLTEDAFLGGSLRLLQPRAGYRAGLDAILLAAAAACRRGLKDDVLDVGADVGAVGLALARRAPGAQVTMVEQSPALARLALTNIERNDLTQRVQIIQADILRPLTELPELNARRESFDQVLANPPYYTEGCGTPPEGDQKAAAHAMPEGSLDRWVRFMAAMCKSGGAATIIHRAEALGDLLAACGKRFGNLVALPIHAREGEPAIRVLVQGIKGSRAPLELRPGLILHDAEHAFRPEIADILRRGAALPLRPERGN